MAWKLYIFQEKNYRKINDAEYLNQLRIKYKKSYIIPEGGTNSLAIRGTESIIKSDEKNLNIYVVQLELEVLFLV